MNGDAGPEGVHDLEIASDRLGIDTEAEAKAIRFLREIDVRRRISDMTMLTMRELNRKTAAVLDALEHG